MTTALIHSALFLINFIFSFYIMLVMLRFLLQWVKADFYNPICQFIIKFTNPLLVPLRRVIPGFFGLDFAAVVLMLLLQLLELLLIAGLTGFPLSAWIWVVAVGRLAQQLLNIYFVAILIRALLSWFSPTSHHPAVLVLIQLTEPILRPARRIIPTISGIDLSPVVVMILLQVISIFLSSLIGT